ncbi:PREDICTED: neurotrypsin-like [Amphimedon queenslandica]|uniref:SRCR domain-containing protein n=1 Tax=Amphimedon queenslandica TaxID=400682 RepID=A0AAN0JBL9_AMPQE|nr:PREDICTED: neurotrypsin-like [Amphimedon queenslandica]|eukprot:XP_019854098.1 PREDICTED: neurotrypsin-like [Amphimedon queenslandica]
MVPGCSFLFAALFLLCSLPEETHAQCVAANYTGCCTAYPCHGAGSSLCYCDASCYIYGDCCPDVASIGCVYLESSCVSAGFTSCCNTSTSSSCRGTGGNSTCYCDQSCYINNDCCPDINQTSCVQSNITETGSCVSAGFSGCCSYANNTSCRGHTPSGNLATCYCDAYCYIFGDCCTDVNATGCYSNSNVTIAPPTEPPSLPDGPPPIRLVGGNTAHEGRVELFIENQWGTICDDAWTSIDAEVVCRQLGFPSSGAVAVGLAHYGQGVGPIVLDNVACSGLETYITDCQNNGYYVHNCAHAEDAGVQCPAPHGSIQYPVRLVINDTIAIDEGRVEIFYNNTWGTICDDYWGYSDAQDSQVL